MGKILVIIELQDKTVDNLSLQLLNKARQLADINGFQVAAIVVGYGLKEIANSLVDKGADKVLIADYPEVADYNPELYTRIISEMITSEKPLLVLLGYSFIGMETGPAIAIRVSLPLISNCIDVEIGSDASLSVVRPVYGGTLQTRLKGVLPAMLSFPKGALTGGTRISKPGSIESFNTNFDIASLHTIVREIRQPTAAEVDITKANVIVGVGRGIGQAANINLARELAKSLGGVIAATRPVVDMGWLPPEYLVGLSGKTVTPKVYIACGMSGAAQHLAGMSDSQLIVAINKDANAAIFNIAHYAIIGDLFQTLPALIEAARTIPSK